jgi:hypothetical protein
MTFHFHTAISTDKSATEKIVSVRPEWSEQTVSVVAVSVGVMIVALIAVLMGMA